MVIADLHVHTTNSDGTLTIDDVPAAARAAGLDAVAITDHDRLHPELDAPVATRDGVTVVHGVELRVAATREVDGETVEQRVDLLGYGVEPTDALTDELDRLQQDRIERARTMVSRLEDSLGVSLDVAFEPGVGRPDVARAVADATDYTVQEVFDSFIHDGGPCYVAREVPSFDRGRRLLSAACDFVGLAHPFRYDDPEAALSLTADLDAVELHYPYEEAVDLAPIERALDAHDLVATGGSDAHGERLGATGLDADEYRRFERALES